MATALPPFAITLPSDLRFLGLARQFVESVCQALHVDDAFREAVLLATHEALQNIIRHAHGDRPEACVEIHLIPIPEGLEVRLLDQGAPFDVGAVPHLDPGQLRIGGRGVFLMRRLMDEVCSEPRSPHGNVLRMVKRCPLAAPLPRRHLA